MPFEFFWEPTWVLLAHNVTLQEGVSNHNVNVN